VHAVYLHQPLLTWAMRTAVTMPPRADAAIILKDVVIRP
jgi:hypothetical protein